MRWTLIFLLAFALSGCLSPGGYVRSDIPGVARTAMEWKKAHANHACPEGTTDVKVKVTEAETMSLLGKGERHAYDVRCRRRH